MSTVRALVVGSLVMDLSFQVPKRPEPGEVILADSFGTYRGGKGYNQAVALARLGASVTMIGALGADAYGDEFIASLDREGIDTLRMVRLPQSFTSIAVPLVTPDGDVGFVHAQGANAELRPDHCRDLPDADVLLLQGEIPLDTSLAVAQQASRQGTIVILNPAPVHHVTAGLIATADIIVANEVEALALLETPATSRADPLDLAQKLATDGRIAVVTLGARGAVWSDGTSSGRATPPNVTAVDATAAGDSFCAALALAFVEGQRLADAVRFACAAGAHAATVRGAEPGLPTRKQVDALLNEPKRSS
ncbi:MAG TPA: ribokinase [Thermomicrobiales bacterium]|nr:ribokinase [Thermomicrobiales bacterium]